MTIAVQISGQTAIGQLVRPTVNQEGARAGGSSPVQASEQAANQRQLEAQQQLAEQAQVRQLAARDREVRAHEQAHASTGGIYASAPVYEFTRGPNGVRYATSGHVNIDVSEVPGDPAATLEKLTQVSRAALAPAQPSPQDRAVAAQAQAGAAQARAELARERNDSTIEGAGQSDAAESAATTTPEGLAESDRRDNRGALPVSSAGRIASATGPSVAETVGTLLNLFA